MRKLLLILFCLAMSNFLMAQETVKQNEIGLVFRNLDYFGLTFRTGTDKSLWRLSTLLISGDRLNEYSDSVLNRYSKMGFQVSIGKEYRKIILDNLEFRLGADISFAHSKTESVFEDQRVFGTDRIDRRTTYQPGINMVFGFNYLLGKNILIGAELLPHFTYRTGESVQTHFFGNESEVVRSDISGFYFGLSSSSVRLSLAYRFR